MKISKMAFVAGAVAATFAGMVVAACSSDDSSNNSNKDAGTQNPDTGATTMPAQDSGNTTPPQDSGVTTPPTDGGTTPMDAACAKPPALHAPSDAGIYCPYSFNDATDSGIQYCARGTQQCCVSPSTDAGISDCENIGSCSNATFKAWQCSAPSDCAGATTDGGADAGPVVCCLISGAVGADSNCSGYQKTKGLDSVTCMAASACQGPITVGAFMDVHYVACEKQSDCDQTASSFGGDGGTCTAVKTSGTPIGLCL